MTTLHTPTVAEDQATRRLAQREFSAPLVIEAGAGTGKTALLVARVVAWCMGEGWARHATGDRDPEEVARRVIERIAAITFTEAAAAEMARKIGEALSGLARGVKPVGWEPDPDAMPESDQECEERAGFLSDEAHRLAVSTIHSFCQRLLGTYPLEAGLHPRFVVDAEEEATRALVVDVVEEALRSLDENPLRPDWEILAGTGIDPPQIAETLQYLVTEGMGASDLELDPFDSDRARKEGAELKRAVLAFAEAERGRFDGLPQSASVSVGARDVVRDLVSEVDGLGPTPTFAMVASLANRRSKKSLDRIAVWATKGFNATESKRLGDAEEAARSAAVDLSRILNRLSVLGPMEFTAARRVLKPMLREVEERRTARGIVSFSDLLFRAAALVENAPGIVREVCSEIDQLLVDEFQDTDAVQCRLVENLAFGDHHPPGLFVVGDPKQSIYAWRNADLAAYGRFVSTVVKNGGDRYPLVQNFRSVEPILDEVSQVIDGVMQEEEDVQPPFVPLLPTGERVGAPGFCTGGRTAVEHWVTWPACEEGDPPAPAKSGLTTAFESESIARDIRELVIRDGVRWGDIAILLRATTAQEDLLEAFRKRGIPYEVAREKEFYKQREVVEAAALVRCVVDPADTVALLTVLRSDVVGVPDRALAPLWDAGLPHLMAQLEGTGGGGLDAVDECISKAATQIPDGIPTAESLPRWPVALHAAVRVIADLRTAFQNDSPDRFVERIRTRWLAEVSAAARFLGRFRRARLERFFTDLEKRLGAGEGGIAGLARYLRQAVEDGQSGAVGGEPDLQANAVHVMTIHGAKGLDFKHVYLVQIHRQSGSPENKDDAKVLPLENCREYRIFGWPTPDFTAAQELKRRQSNAELIRLLYVAMTRAKDRLVVSGGWNAPRKDKKPLDAGSFADLLDGRLDQQALQTQIEFGAARRVEDGNHSQWVVPALDAAASDDPSESESGDPGLKDLAEIRREAEVLAGARTAASERMARALAGGASTLEGEIVDRHGEEEESLLEAFGGDRNVATAVGSAVHKMMEHLDLDGDLALQLNHALELGLTDAQSKLDTGPLAEARDRLNEVIGRITGGNCLKVLAAVAPDVVGREIAVVAPPQNDRGPVGAITGFVDLVYRDPDDGRIVVADYKTDTVEGEEAVAERVRVYKPQVSTYARALREALGLEYEPHVELWFLAADKIVRL